jgi:hypothetical protein
MQDKNGKIHKKVRNSCFSNFQFGYNVVRALRLIPKGERIGHFSIDGEVFDS